MTIHVDTPPDVLDRNSLAAAKQRRARWLFWVLLIVVSPVVLLLAGIAALLIWIQVQLTTGMREVRVEVERIHAAGEPITTADLFAYHRVPPGTKDITAYWLKAVNSFNEQQFNTDYQALSWSSTEIPPRLSPEQITEGAAFLAKYDVAVQATLAAAEQQGECRFAVDFDKGMSALLPHAQKMRTLVRLMSMRARAAAVQGDGERAVESIAAELACSRALSHQLTLIEHLVRLASAASALGDIEAVLNTTKLTDQQLARLQAEVQALDVRSGLTTSLIGERGMGYHAFHHLEQMSGGNVTAPPNPGEGTLSRPGDCRVYLGFLQEMIDASREPFPAAQQKATQSEMRLKALAGSRNPLERYNAMITLMILPATTASFQATARDQAQRDLTVLAIAARRFELAHGELPANLSALVPDLLPAVPGDPFDGQPLRMVAAPNELRLYSIGKDLKDDGGQESQVPGEPDIVVRLSKP